MEFSSAFIAYGALAIILYTLYGAIFRLYLSPIAKFPGPKLAALSFWYEFYYDVILGGQYVYEIERMHKKYGKHTTTHHSPYFLWTNMLGE